MKYIFLTFVLFGAALICQAQLIYSLDDDAAYITTVENDLKHATSDSTQAYLCLKLSVLCKLLNDTAKSNAYLKRGISLGQNNPFLYAASFFYRAHALYITRDVVAIEKNLVKGDSLLNAFQQPEAFKIRGYIWQSYGSWQQIKGDEKAAMDAFVNKALPYAKQSGDPYLLGNVFKAIAIVFMNADQREKAASYLQDAITHIQRSPKNNPTRLEALTETYIIAAENCVYLKQLDSTHSYLQHAHGILAPQPKSNLYISYYYAEGLYFDKQKNYGAAITSFDKGIAMAEGPASQFSRNRLNYSKYKALTNNNEHKKAVVVLEEILQSPVLLATDKKLYYKELYHSYAQLGNTREAYHWAGEYITLSDSLYDLKQTKDIAELETKYKAAENQKHILELEAQQERAVFASKRDRLWTTILAISSISLLLVTALGLLYYRNSKKLYEQKEVNYQQLLKEADQQQQIQFTKALLQGEEKERNRLARDLHDGLGGMLAGVKMNLTRLTNEKNTDLSRSSDLTKVIDLLDNSVTELRRIARNLIPESLLQFGLETSLKDLCDSLNGTPAKIDFQAFDIAATLPKEKQVIIYRIVQELLTNAIRHAQASHIVVQCSQNENTFFITIEDNGVGLQQKSPVVSNGIGLSNVKNRVDFMSGKLDIAGVPGEGTTINIEFSVA